MGQYAATPEIPTFQFFRPAKYFLELVERLQPTLKAVSLHLIRDPLLAKRNRLAFLPAASNSNVIEICSGHWPGIPASSAEIARPFSSAKLSVIMMRSFNDLFKLARHPAAGIPALDLAFHADEVPAAFAKIEVDAVGV